MVNEVLKRFYNATVYMEIRVYFTGAKFENDMLALCETTNVLIDALCYSKIHLHQLGPFRLINTMFNSVHVCYVYLQYGIFIQRVVTRKELPSVQ